MDDQRCAVDETDDAAEDEDIRALQAIADEAWDAAIREVERLRWERIAEELGV